MTWLKSNLKEILAVLTVVGGGLGYVADLVYDNGVNSGTIKTSKEYQPKVDTLNAKLNRVSGRAAVWKLQLDDC